MLGFSHGPLRGVVRLGPFARLQHRCFSSTSDYTQKPRTFLEATFLTERDDMLCTQCRVAKVVMEVRNEDTNDVIAIKTRCHIYPFKRPNASAQMPRIVCHCHTVRAQSRRTN